jgi:hypothetical protein
MTDFTATVAALRHSDDVLADLAAREGAYLLDEVAAWLRRYLSVPSEDYLVVIALWAAHTWVVEAFYVTPAADHQLGRGGVRQDQSAGTAQPDLPGADLHHEHHHRRALSAVGW